MRTLSDTIDRLAKFRGNHRQAVTALASDRLTDLAGFGTNPGALSAKSYIPADLPPGAPLVVVLHACAQTAADYDHGAGWSRLVDDLGFVLSSPSNSARTTPIFVSTGSCRAISDARPARHCRFGR